MTETLPKVILYNNIEGTDFFLIKCNKFVKYDNGEAKSLLY